MDPQGMPPQMPPQGMPPQMPAGDPSQGPPQGAPANEQPVTPQQKQALLDMIKQVRDKISTVKAMSFAGNQKTEILRQQLLQKVFTNLEAAGVDLSSRESVAAFIQNLQQRNPELAQMFEKSMDTLMGVKSMQPPTPGMSPGGGQDEMPPQGGGPSPIADPTLG